MGGLPLPKSKYNMADRRHLENRYDVIIPQCVVRFGRNSAPWCRFTRRFRITAKWSRSKPEVEFQYGGRFFFQTGSSYISAVNWDMWTKFGLLVDFDLLKAATSTNTKLEVVLSGRGCHLDKWIWHISAVCAPIWMKFGSLMQNDMQITRKWSRSKPEVEFQYGGRVFFKKQK